MPRFAAHESRQGSRTLRGETSRPCPTNRRHDATAVKLPPDGCGDASSIEPVRRQDLVVLPAPRDLRDPDLRDAGSRCRHLFGEGREHGVALPAGDVVVVERDDGRAVGDVGEPRAVDVAQPRQRDDARLDPVLGEQLRGVPGGRDHYRAGGNEDSTSFAGRRTVPRPGESSSIAGGSKPSAQRTLTSRR